MINGAGNGLGKTYGLVAAMAAIFWPQMAPPSLRIPTFQDWKFPKRARIISTPKEIEEIGAIQTTIKDLWPAGQYEAMKKGKAYPSQFKTSSGFVVDVMSYDQNATEFAGPNLGLVVFNEPPPENIFKESLARTRKGGIVLMAMTSLLENPWIVSGLLERADGKDIRVVYSQVEMNCRDHFQNGTLSHDQIEKILAQYDPDEREARSTGKPLSFSGRIFKTFDRSVHVAKEDIKPSSEMEHYMVVDPAIGKPLAIIWAQVDRAGVVQIYREWPDFEFQGAKDSAMGSKEYSDLIRELEGPHKASWRILDRHFGNVRRTLGGQSLKQEFADHGLDFVDSYSVAADQAEVETGVLKIKDFLRYDKAKPIDSLNCPRLIISPTCRNTIAAMEKWGRDPKTGKPMEAYKDFADTVRYLVMANPEIEERRPAGKARPAHYGVGT